MCRKFAYRSPPDAELDAKVAEGSSDEGYAAADKAAAAVGGRDAGAAAGLSRDNVVGRAIAMTVMPRVAIAPLAAVGLIVCCNA